jgi:hypothetical protein
MRQIETLLGYPKVGPLSPSAIVINLGTEEDTIQPDLDSLAQQGRIIRLRSATSIPVTWPRVHRHQWTQRRVCGILHNLDGWISIPS